MSPRPNVGFSTVAIVPSASAFRSAVGGTLGGEVGRASRKAGRDSGDTIGRGILRGFGPALAVTVGVAVLTAAGRALGSGIRAASDLSESTNAVRVSFGAAADEVLALGRGAARTVGLSNAAYNGLAVQFSATARSLAGDGVDVAATIQSLTGRAADFASVMNLDVSEAAALFQSGLAGETEPLRQFGIDLSASAVSAYAYANGIANAGAALTEAEKVQARYGLLLAATDSTSGDFTKTQGGLANGLRILGASWTDLQAKLGTAFLPFAAAAVAGLNLLMPALGAFAERFADFGSGIQAIYDGAGGGPAGLRAMLDALAGIVGDFVTGGGLAAFLDAFAAFYFDDYLRAIVEGIPAAVAFLLDAVPTFLLFLAQTWIPAVVGELAVILGMLAQTAALVLPQVATALAEVLPGLVTALLRMVPALLAAATALAETLATALAEVVPALVTGLDLALPPLFLAIAGIAPPLISALLAVLPGLVDGALALFLGLVEGLSLVLPALLASLLAALPALVDTVAAMLPGLIDGALALFLGLVEGLVQTVPALLVALLGALPLLVGTLLDMLPALIVGAIDLFFGLVFGLLEVLPDLLSTLLVDVLPNLVASLIRMLPQLTEGAVLLFAGILAGLLANLPTLLGSFARLIPDAIRGLLAGLPDLVSVGVDMMRGLAEGFARNAAAIVGGLLALAGVPVDATREALEIRSPSRVFAEHGADAALALAPEWTPDEPELGEGVIDRIRRTAPGRIAYDYTQVGGEAFPTPEAAERALRGTARHLRAV